MDNSYRTEVSNFRGFPFIYFLGVGQISKKPESLFSVVYPECYQIHMGHIKLLQHVGGLFTHDFSK